MLEALLYPSSVAVIGASMTAGKVGNAVTRNLIKGGFEGEIVPVNPSGGEFMGQKFYPSLEEYGKPIEMSVIAVPTKAVMGAVVNSLRAGAKAIVVITAGFKEVDEEGAALEAEIAQLCHSHGARLMGPNCLGLINTHHKMDATFANYMPQSGGISVLSQSGALCTAILDWAQARRMGLASLVSIGNKADIDETDLLAAFASDSKTKVIAGYLESILSGDEFVRVAESVAQVKPVVIMKAGTTSAGSKAASSHTGALAGADIAYGAAFKRAGVIRAETFEALFDYATALAMQPLPKGNRVAIITNAGGPGIMAADAVEHAGLQVASLSPETIDSLRGQLPAAASVSNPIDVLGDAGPERYAQAVDAAQNDPTVDAIIVILTPQAMTQPLETAQAIAARVNGEKPVLTTFMGGTDVTPGRDELVAANLPDYPSPERAAATLKAMWEYASWRKRPPRVVTRFPVNKRRVERIITRQARTGRTYMGEARAKEILRAYDFTVPEGRLVSTVDEAVEMAPRIGYPLAMKISSQDIIHKSDVGGVKLNLSSPQDVADAYELMMMRISRRMPDAVLDGVYLERMAPKGREVILGMTRDPQFGPMLMFGLGGIFVEVMKDVTFHLAPITHDEAMQMLIGTRSYALLTGVRGQEGVNLAAIGEALQRISQLVTDFPQIEELDINPFIVGTAGQDSVAADARIQLKAGGETMSEKINPRYDPEWQEKYADLIMTAADAVASVRPGQRIFISTAGSQPLHLVEALVARHAELADTQIIHSITLGAAPYAYKELSDHFSVNSFFVGANVRDTIQAGYGDYTPVNLSDVPRLFSSGRMPIDVALIQVTPPDRQGRCSLGISVDIVKSATANAGLVIAQVNPQMPWTMGDSFVSIYDLDILVPVDEPLTEATQMGYIIDDVGTGDLVERSHDLNAAIGEHIASLVEDGATLEIGIGRVPHGVIEFLKDKKDIGIHTEVITDAVIDLIESGVINGSQKALDRGKIVTSFAMGTKRLYDYLDGNPLFSFNPTEYVNDPFIIGQQNKMVAINTALEIDLTGQVCADSLGTQFYSGIGGQADFNEGAARSNDGRAIIALPSTAKKGTVSRIVATLRPGGGVVTGRGRVHYVVTEYGIAYLHGKTVQERAMALISIAHPNFREELLAKAIEYKYVRPEMEDVEGRISIGPKELKTTMLLDDGTLISFRPIHPTDEPATRDLFYSLSQETVYYRYMSHMKRIPRKQMQNFVYIDHRNEVAIVGTVPEAAGDEIIAIGRYYLDQRTNRAEVAFVVRDDWQNKGIGSFILHHLTTIAKRNGIAGFTAEIMRDNKAMQAVVNKSGLKVDSKLSDGVYHFEMDF